MLPYARYIILAGFGVLSLIILFSWKGNDIPMMRASPEHSKQNLFKTPLGLKTYSDVEFNVFRPLGYKIIRETLIPTLDYVEEPVCSKVFIDWLEAGSETQDESAPPPKEIPPGMLDQYTLSNYTQLVMAPFWRDERSGVRSETWSEDYINRLLQLDITDPEFAKYPNEGRAVYYAMKAYSSGVAGKPGAVIGSTDPWVETYALKLDASHVTTMEYMKIITQHPKMSYEHPVQVAKDYTRFIEAYDWIATYSSVEHSGLGRYGDALDPFGDLKEAMKMYCMLKRGGYLFFSVPVGYDTIYFNWHRVYGRIRLALMFAGFDLVEIFYQDFKRPVEEIAFEGKPGDHTAPVAVLRKR